MAIGETARLLASLDLKDGLTPAVKTMSGSLDKFDARIGKSSSKAEKAGRQIGTGIKAGAVIAAGAIGFLAGNVALGLQSLEGLEEVTTQTNAVIKSTAGAAGETSDAIREMSNRLEGLNATMDDTAIQSGANVLLTFTNIRKQAFEPALTAALNLSTAMKQDLQSSVVQIGKALNDPIKGLTALQRVGVTFTAQQKEQVAALVSSGSATKDLQKAHVALTKDQAALIKGLGSSASGLDAADKAGVKLTKGQREMLKGIKDGTGLFAAQRIILAELDKEFGGSFLAGGQTTAAKIAKAEDAVDDLQRSLATALLPAIGKVSDAISKFLTKPEIVKGVSDLGDKIAGLFSDQNLAIGGKAIEDVLTLAQQTAPVLEESAKKVGEVVKTAVGLFRSLPPEIQSLAVAGFAVNKLTGGLVTNIAGGLISAVISSFKGLMNVNAAVVNVNGPVGGLGAIPGGLPGTAAGAGALGIIGTAGIIAAAGVGSAYAFSQLASGPKAGPGAFTPTIGGAFAPKSVAASDFEKINWGKIAADLEAGGRVPAGTVPASAMSVGDHSGDASEKAVKSARTAFTSNPTRNELRTQIGQLKVAQKNAVGANAIAVGKKVAALQSKLDNRIATANRQAIAAADAAKRAIVAAIAAAAPVVNPIINVPVTTQTLIDGRLVSASFSRYTSVIGGRVVNGTSGSGV